MASKFIFLVIQFFTFTTYVVAQEVVLSFFQKGDNPVDKIEESYYYRNTYLDTIINNAKIYRIEEFYSLDNSAKTLGYSTVDKSPFKYIGELQRFYPNKNLASIEKYNLSGLQIDTAYYFHSNKSLKLILNRDLTVNDPLSYKSINYIAYFDSSQTPLLKNGDGFIRVDLKSGLVSDDSLNYEEGILNKNRREGLWKGVSGKYKFEENYTNGSLLKGKCLWPDGTVVDYNESTIQKDPEYPGGLDALAKFIRNNFRYLEEAISAKVSGTIIVDFIVDEFGDIQNIVVKKDLGYNTSKEAVKVVQKMGRWRPGSLKGVPHQVSFSLPVGLHSFGDSVH